MSRSALSIKISVCELVESLNDDGCVDVIRSLQNELGHGTFITIIRMIIIQHTQGLSKQSLIKIEKMIKDRYFQHSTSNIASATNIHNTLKNSVLFPLDRLPNDLVFKTSLFFDEQDIFQFEQCCRFFYKMINNTSYLSQCNNFKEFIITKERLREMRQAEYGFFKYSKTNKLTTDIDPSDYLRGTDMDYSFEASLVATANDFETTMNAMKKMGSYDNWWINIVKSISILDVGFHDVNGILLSRMPLDILFNPDPNKSNLKRIRLSHFATIGHVKNTWDYYMNKFEEKYLQCKNKWEQQGLKIKSLECVQHERCIGILNDPVAAINNPRYILAVGVA